MSNDADSARFLVTVARALLDIAESRKDQSLKEFEAMERVRAALQAYEAAHPPAAQTPDLPVLPGPPSPLN